MSSVRSENVDSHRRQRQSLFYPKADLPLPPALLRNPDQIPFSLSLETIADLCCCSLRQKVRGVSPLGETGTLHRLWRVELASGQAVIFRANAIPEWYCDYPLQIDRGVSKILAARGIASVGVLEVDLSREKCATDYAILEVAPGLPLTRFDADEPKMQSYLAKLGVFLAKVHETRIHKFGLLDGTEPLQGCHDSWAEYIYGNLDRHLDDCRRIGALGIAESDQIQNLFAEHRPLLDNVPSALLHGDPGSHNVFVSGNAISCLIDWEDALAGDPVYEIAFWATFHPLRRHASFLEGYRSVAELPDDFETRFWLYFLRVALAKTVLRDRLGLRDRPDREPASRRIQMALDRLERAIFVS